MPCCGAVNCSNKPEKGFRLFRFPANVLRRAKWLQNMRRDNWTPVSTSRLCEIHFEVLQFENNRADGWRKLKPTAIPTLFDVQNPPPKIEPSQKLLYKLSSTERRSEKKRNKSDSLEESEDPSSENVSTGSGESNVVGTDDDDLEKKIQAFAIPVKKENVNMSFKSENTVVNTRNNKSDVLENSGEVSKYVKKVEMKKERVCAELKGMKDSGNEETFALETGSESGGTSRKKEKQNKTKNKSNKGEKKMSVDKELPDQQVFQNIDKNSDDAKNVTTKLSERVQKNKKTEKSKSTSSVRKSVKERSHQDLSESESDSLQKGTAQKDEKSSVSLEMNHDNGIKAELSRKSTSATVAKKRNLKNTERKPNVDATKKAKLNVKSLSSPNNKKMTRNTRISSISRKGKKISESTSHDSHDSKQLHVSKDVKKIRLKNIKGRIDSSLKKNKNTVRMKTRERPIERKRKPSRDSVTPKDDKGQQKRQKLIDLKKNNDKISVSAEKDKISNEEAQNISEKPILDTKVETNFSDVFDGEELFEKIYDILEDSNKIIELTEKRNSMAFKLHSCVQKAVSLSKEILLPHHPSIFKPNLLQKHTKFPCDSKGTVPYQKLWKWSHYVKMPSDMWSLHKHPNGNFVVVFHISEMSPFPELIIDKYVLFKETASPCVKIYGKDVLALSSENELKTLGNVCSFLKHIHDISLCEGKFSSATGESSENCELYTDEKLSMPFKCKFCQLNS